MIRSLRCLPPGVSKAMTAFLSGEMRDTVELVSLRTIWFLTELIISTSIQRVHGSSKRYTSLFTPHSSFTNDVLHSSFRAKNVPSSLGGGLAPARCGSR